MKRFLAGFASVPLQAILVASFSLVAATTIGAGALATSPSRCRFGPPRALRMAAASFQ
jgi:hypothetical protein